MKVRNIPSRFFSLLFQELRLGLGLGLVLKVRIRVRVTIKGGLKAKSMGVSKVRRIA